MDEDELQIPQLPRVAPQGIPQLPRVGGVAEEEEEDDRTFFERLSDASDTVADKQNAIAAAFLGGIFEPLGVIPGIGGEGGVLDRLQGVEDQGELSGATSLGATVAGFAVPGGAALKGTQAALGGTRLAQAGRAAGAGLGARSALRAAEGGITGAAFGAGLEAESGRDRLVNTAIGAATGVVGDPTLGAVFDGGAAILRGVLGREGSARAVSLIHVLDGVEDEAAQTTLGRLARSETSLLRPGELAILPQVKGERAAVESALGGLEGVEFRSILDPGRNAHNILVGTTGQIPDEAVTMLAKEGFFPGQKVLDGGAEWSVVKRNTSNGSLRLERYTSEGLDSRWVPTSQQGDLTFLPYGEFQQIASVPELPSRWRAFAKEHGDQPENFDSAFTKFIADQQIPQGEVAGTRNFLLNKTLEAYKAVDPEMAAQLKRNQEILRSAHHLKNTPEEVITARIDGNFRTQGRKFTELETTISDLQRLAANKGMWMESDLINGKIQWVVQGGAKQGDRKVYEFIEEAAEHINSVTVEAPQMIPDGAVPLPSHMFAVKGRIDGMPTYAHSAGGYGGIHSMEDIALQEEIRQLAIAAASPEAFKTPVGSTITRHLAPVRAIFASIDDAFTRVDGGSLGLSTHFDNFDSARKLSIRAIKPIDQHLKAGLKAIKREPLARMGVIQNALEVGNPSALTKAQTKAYDELVKGWGKHLDSLREAGVTSVTNKDFLQTYMPALRKLPADKVVTYIRGQLGDKADEPLLSMIEKIGNQGVDFAWKENPFHFLMMFARKSNMERFGGQVMDQMESTRIALRQRVDAVDEFGRKTATPEMQEIALTYDNYLKVAVGDTPEAYAIARESTAQMLKAAGIDLKPTDLSRYTSLLMSLSYGASMAFRPALAARNLTQTLATTWMLNGNKHTAVGLVSAIRNFATLRDEAIEAGAITARDPGLMFSEQIRFADIATRLDEGVAKRSVRKGQPLGEQVRTSLGNAGSLGLKAATEVGAAGAELGQKGLQLGLYNWSDEFNRVVAYKAGKEKAREALLRKTNGVINEEQFIRESGLWFHGEEVAANFNRMLTNSKDSETALRYMGVQSSNQTQWIYAAHSAPLLTSRSPLLKVFGQYSTWPLWYMSMVGRFVARGDKRQIASAFAKTVGLSSAMAAAGVGRWSPMTSFTFLGEPGGTFGDFLTTGAAIVAGGPGGSPEQSMALSSLGLRRTGEIDLPGFDPIPGLGFREGENSLGLPKGPVGMFTGSVGKFVPGMQAMNTITDGLLNAPDPISGAARAIGFPRSLTQRVLGAQWPGVKR